MKLLPIQRMIGGSRRKPQTIRTQVVAEALVDDCFYYQCAIHRWTLSSDGYPKAKINGKDVKLHHFIWSLAGNVITKSSSHEFELHHINDNKLDAQLENLELLSNSDHRKTQVLRKISKTGECGITLNRKRFQVKFHENGKHKAFGSYLTLAEAISVRNREFARIFPGRALPR